MGSVFVDGVEEKEAGQTEGPPTGSTPDIACGKPGCKTNTRLTMKFGAWWCDSHAPLYDPVNRPKHYTIGGIEVIDFIEAWALGFHEGNVVKYVARAKHKGNELEDLKKAQSYLNRRIEKLEGKK